MINKEERETIERLKKDFDIISDDNTIKRDVIKILDLIDKQETRIKELEEIEQEHQKLNGELQKKLTYYEEICKGKAIQEMGMSDLYKEGIE